MAMYAGVHAHPLLQKNLSNTKKSAILHQTFNHKPFSLSRSLTSSENRLSKSCSMAIASCAASTVPNAGISLVLLVPGVGYLETEARGGRARYIQQRRRRWKQKISLFVSKTRRSRAIGGEKQRKKNTAACAAALLSESLT